jgi:hypothetical protein
MESKEPIKNKKRKLPIMLLGAVALVIVIVVNIVVWRGYFDKQAQAGALNVEVQQVKQLIAQAAEPPSELKSQLAAVQADLENALAVFPENIDRNDIFDFILDTAEECQVQIIPLISEGKESGGTGRSYKVLKYHGTVTGSLGHTSSFMTKLHSGKYSTMIISDCTVQRVSQEGNISSIDDITVVVELNLALYVSSIKGE